MVKYADHDIEEKASFYGVWSLFAIDENRIIICFKF